MLKFTKISIILLLFFTIFSIGIFTVSAASLLNDASDNSDMALKADSACMVNGNCQLNDFTRVAVNISKIILGLVGSLSLLAFIAGGLMMMLSGGKQETVTRGKQTIIGAVIGLTVVFTSYMIIQLVFNLLGINFTGTIDFPKQTQQSATQSATLSAAEQKAQWQRDGFNSCNNQRVACVTALGPSASEESNESLQACIAANDACLAQYDLYLQPVQ